MVHEAYAGDVGKGIARVDAQSMKRLGMSEGDVLEINGKRRTVARCLQMYPSGKGNSIIRIDGLGRNNAGVDIGNMVQVRKVSAPEATSVVLVPLEEIPPVDGKYLADKLDGVPLNKGDNLLVLYFGGNLPFQVANLDPNLDVVLVTKNTTFQIAKRGPTA